MRGNGELVMRNFSCVFDNAVTGTERTVNEKEAKMPVPCERIAVQSLYQKGLRLKSDM